MPFFGKSSKGDLILRIRSNSTADLKDEETKLVEPKLAKKKSMGHVHFGPGPQGNAVDRPGPQTPPPKAPQSGPFSASSSSSLPPGFTEKQLRAAILVQSMWRGYKIRKAVEAMRSQKHKQAMRKLFAMSRLEQQMKQLEGTSQNTEEIKQKFEEMKQEQERAKEALKKQVTTFQQAKVSRVVRVSKQLGVPVPPEIVALQQQQQATPSSPTNIYEPLISPKLKKFELPLPPFVPPQTSAAASVNNAPQPPSPLVAQPKVDNGTARLSTPKAKEKEIKPETTTSPSLSSSAPLPPTQQLQQKPEPQKTVTPPQPEATSANVAPTVQLQLSTASSDKKTDSVAKEPPMPASGNNEVLNLKLEISTSSSSSPQPQPTSKQSPPVSVVSSLKSTENDQKAPLTTSIVGPTPSLPEKEKIEPPSSLSPHIPPTQPTKEHQDSSDSNGKLSSAKTTDISPPPRAVETNALVLPPLRAAVPPLQQPSVVNSKVETPKTTSLQPLSGSPPPPNPTTTSDFVALPPPRAQPPVASQKVETPKTPSRLPSGSPQPTAVSAPPPEKTATSTSTSAPNLHHKVETPKTSGSPQPTAPPPRAAEKTEKPAATPPSVGKNTETPTSAHKVETPKTSSQSPHPDLPPTAVSAPPPRAAEKTEKPTATSTSAPNLNHKVETPKTSGSPQPTAVAAPPPRAVEKTEKPTATPPSVGKNTEAPTSAHKVETPKTSLQPPSGSNHPDLPPTARPAEKTDTTTSAPNLNHKVETPKTSGSPQPQPTSTAAALPPPRAAEKTEERERQPREREQQDLEEKIRLEMEKLEREEKERKEREKAEKQRKLKEEEERKAKEAERQRKLKEEKERKEREEAERQKRDALPPGFTQAELEAAQRLQSIWRGYKARKFYEVVRAERHKQQIRQLFWMSQVEKKLVVLQQALESNQLNPELKLKYETLQAEFVQKKTEMQQSVGSTQKARTNRKVRVAIQLGLPLPEGVVPPRRLSRPQPPPTPPPPQPEPEPEPEPEPPVVEVPPLILPPIARTPTPRSSRTPPPITPSRVPLPLSPTPRDPTPPPPEPEPELDPEVEIDSILSIIESSVGEYLEDPEQTVEETLETACTFMDAVTQEPPVTVKRFILGSVDSSKFFSDGLRERRQLKSPYKSGGGGTTRKFAASTKSKLFPDLVSSSSSSSFTQSFPLIDSLDFDLSEFTQELLWTLSPEDMWASQRSVFNSSKTGQAQSLYGKSSSSRPPSIKTSNNSLLFKSSSFHDSPTKKMLSQRAMSPAAAPPPPMSPTVLLLLPRPSSVASMTTKKPAPAFTRELSPIKKRERANSLNAPRVPTPLFTQTRKKEGRSSELSSSLPPATRLPVLEMSSVASTPTRSTRSRLSDRGVTPSSSSRKIVPGPKSALSGNNDCFYVG